MQYIGNELDLFAKARRWKAYWSRQISPYLRGDVLEVGAGLGSNIPYLLKPAVRSLTGIEPDPDLYQHLDQLRQTLADPRFTTKNGILSDLGNAQFDTVLYLDVLEHIEHDRDELIRAERALRQGGHLVVLVPAHQFLYSPFDKAIGHYRRYNRKTLAAVGPPGCKLVTLRALDSVGFMASLANAMMLGQSAPTEKQILFWDGVLVRSSILVDPVLAYRAGKSVLAVWRKEAGGRTK